MISWSGNSYHRTHSKCNNNDLLKNENKIGKINANLLRSWRKAAAMDYCAGICVQLTKSKSCNLLQSKFKPDFSKGNIRAHNSIQQKCVYHNNLLHFRLNLLPKNEKHFWARHFRASSLSVLPKDISHISINAILYLNFPNSLRYYHDNLYYHYYLQ